MRDDRPSVDYDDSEGILTVSTDSVSLLIRIQPSDLQLLAAIPGASWLQRNSITAGTTLGSPVFWCRDEEAPDTAVILVGGDDETWELALHVPMDLVIGLAT